MLATALAWLSRRLVPVLLIAAAVALALGLLWLNSCHSARTAQTETKLATGQAQAALQSGQDAVATLGNRMEAESAIDDLTRNNADAIRKAKGADAPVDPAVRDAGLAGLCRRAAYRGDPGCVQHADPR